MNSGIQYIHVRAQAGAKRESVRKLKKGTFAVAVRAEPENGRANAAIRSALAKTLTVPTSALRLVKGRLSPSKTYLLANQHTYEDKC